MAHNSHNYGWPQRSSQPVQPSSIAMDQHPFSQPQTLPPTAGYPIGYGPQPPGAHSFYPPGTAAAPYFPPQPGVPQTRQQPRSSSIPYAFPSTQVTASPSPLQSQAYAAPAPSYMMNQQEYYLAQGSSVSSNPSSLTVSPPPQTLMTPSTVYSSPDSAPASSDADQQQVRVISFRPKPQCWDHGCNGREFSTFSNLLRHQREKSGVVAKAECPSCGAVFTRTTARNIHVAQGKCKGGGREKSTD
ncbi:hypothetical protein BJX96DRAFT_50328 [Aspergillus floccosus]